MFVGCKKSGLGGVVSDELTAVSEGFGGPPPCLIHQFNITVID